MASYSTNTTSSIIGTGVGAVAFVVLSALLPSIWVTLLIYAAVVLLGYILGSVTLGNVAGEFFRGLLIGANAAVNWAVAAIVFPHLLGPVPGAIHLRSDLERKRLYGVGETERLGPDAYTEEANRKVYATLRTKAHEVLAAGHAALVDAVFARPEERAEIEAAAAELGVTFRGIWLEAPPGTLLDRVGARTGSTTPAASCPSARSDTCISGRTPGKDSSTPATLKKRGPADAATSSPSEISAT